jgi:epsilon-lactone hydrolase
MHGGGFVGGSIYSHRKLFGHLAKAAGVRALVFDYRLTPEHTHPAQVDDAVAAYRWLLEQGIDAGHVAFTGDSSGGGSRSPPSFAPGSWGCRCRRRRCPSRPGLTWS